MTFNQTGPATTTRWSPWDYRDTSWLGKDITGFTVEALDGDLGKVDDATHDVGSSYLIVDTGPLIFGKKVMLPAGVVSAIDHQNRRAMVDRTKEQVKNAPEFDEHRLNDSLYRREFDTYYGEGGLGWTQPMDPRY